MDREVESPISNASIEIAGQRKAWHRPMIEDADISAITGGSGTSGVEGSAFLKPGS